MDLTASISDDMGQLLNSLNSQLEVDAQDDTSEIAISPHQILPQLTPPSISGKDSMECESSPSSSSSGYSSQSGGGTSSVKSGGGRKINIDQIALNLASDSNIRPLFNSHVSGDSVKMEIPSFEADLSSLQNNLTDENCAEIQPFPDSTIVKRARNRKFNSLNQTSAFSIVTNCALSFLSSVVFILCQNFGAILNKISTNSGRYHR